MEEFLERKSSLERNGREREKPNLFTVNNSKWVYEVEMGING